MSIEAGARAGMVAPDETTFAYLKGRPFAPKGAALGRRGRVLAHAAERRRRGVRPRGRARRRRHRADGHLGHQPGGRAADHRPRARPGRRAPIASAAAGMERRARLHGPDARHAARRASRSTASSSAPAPMAASRICAPPPRSPTGAARRRAGLVVPGSRLVKRAGRGGGARPHLPRRRLRVARRRLLDVRRHERRHSSRRASAAPRPPTAISTAARGQGARTHLMSPAMAAAAAVTGRLTDVRRLHGGAS